MGDASCKSQGGEPVDMLDALNFERYIGTKTFEQMAYLCFSPAQPGRS